MLSDAHARGVAEALEHFGVKSAGILRDAARAVIGSPGRAFVEGPAAFRPGGTLHWSNVFWPTQHGTLGNWLGRAGTLAAPFAIAHAVKNHDDDGVAASALGAVGSLAGAAYGGMAGGMVGLPIGSAIGQRLGHGIGHALLGPRKDPYQ